MNERGDVSHGRLLSETEVVPFDWREAVIGRITRLGLNLVNWTIWELIAVNRARRLRGTCRHSNCLIRSSSVRHIVADVTGRNSQTALATSVIDTDAS